MKKALIVILSILVAGLAFTSQATGISPAPITGPTCSMPPKFIALSIDPQEIRDPSVRNVEISIAGIVSVPENCEVTAGYILESSTGLLQGDITIAPDGSFYKTFMANVSGSVLDREGRVYTGTLFAVDADGDKSAVEFTVTVLQEKSQKNDFPIAQKE